MKVEKLIEIIGSDFYAGVPDSQLKALCNYLMSTYGIDPKHHIIAANEGNCVGIAAGYHLATGKIPVVYMQNSGEGNIINPVASLLNEKVYAIPAVFIIGWRGEPEFHDEPQHIFQGEITLKLLEDMDINYYVIGGDTSDEDVQETMQLYRSILKKGKGVAFVIRKGALTYDETVTYKNDNFLSREFIIEQIVKYTDENPIVCTTGKASRELFEIREKNKMSHQYDFLTVGSMGHASSIALGVAINKPNKKVWCIDGDGAMLMHMGALAVIGNNAPNNLVHVVINNGSHETVGGMPTVTNTMDLCQIAKGCGYSYVVRIKDGQSLGRELEIIKAKDELCFVEILSAIGARKELGRPTRGPIENKLEFQKCYREDNK